MLLGVQHTGFITKNIDQLYDFYTKLPGVKVIVDMYVLDDYVIKSLSGYKTAKTKMFWIQIGKDQAQSQEDLNTSRVEFIEYLEPVGKDFDLENNSSGNAHVSICTDDIDQEYQRLVQKGIKFSCPPITIDSAGNAMDGVKVVYFQDPDGRTVELMEFPGHSKKA